MPIPATATAAPSVAPAPVARPTDYLPDGAEIAGHLDVDRARGVLVELARLVGVAQRSPGPRPALDALRADFPCSTRWARSRSPRQAPPWCWSRG